MRAATTLAITTALAALGLAATCAQAQPGAKPVAKAPAPRAAKAPAAPPEPELAKAGGEQLAAAAMAHFGDYQCEFDEVIHVDVHRKHDGYLDVRHRKAVYTMKPVLSSTGALRLEDVRGRMLMLQIANKSMLMDTKAGQRVVDNCVHERQREAASRPPAAGSSLGIDSSKASTAASAPR